MSDQDFFFDEEEEATPASKSVARPAKSSKPAPKATAATTASPSVLDRDVSMTVAALMAVIALLLGVIIGLVIPTSGVGGTASTPAATSSDANVAAPQLTEDQLGTGELPAGHPDISSMGAESTATPASGETTPAE
ncbi:MAG: hypothetical protein Q7J82_02570 [Coriobacteriia bacterium]|nr:hypothetical protein [Coriobacteriia bacterium]